MKTLYYSRTFRARYKSIPNIVVTIDYEKGKHFVINSNGVNINDLFLKHTKSIPNILLFEDTWEKAGFWEIGLEYILRVLNVGLNHPHYDVNEEVIVKMVDGKLKDLVDFSKIELTDEMHKIMEEATSDKLNDLAEEKIKAGTYNSLKQKLQQKDEEIKEKNEEIDFVKDIARKLEESHKKEVEEKEKLQKTLSDEWRTITQALTKGIDDKKTYEKAVDKVVSETDVIEERGRQIISFLTTVPDEVFDTLVKKEKAQVKTFKKIITEAKLEQHFINENKNRAEKIL